jgi:tetratricopeptide (TPR) repeat protein
MLRRLTVLLLLAACLSVAAFSAVRLEKLGGERREEDALLYLPNGKYLKVASLGQAQVLADLIYLWAIQYYSSYGQVDRGRYVEHVFGNVITELDPHYLDPYWIGALILTVEIRDLEGGLRLLDRGFERNPEAWILPYLAGWESYHAGQLDRAADYFDVASTVPGVPGFVTRTRAGILGRAGHYRRALETWTAVYSDPTSDEATRKIAKRQLRSLKARAELEELAAAIARFRTDNGRYPHQLAELVERAYIGYLPRDPADRDYLYDPRTGRVSSSAERLLGGPR